MLSQTLILNKTDTFALSSLQNTEYEKTTIFEKDYREVFNNLPNDIHSEKSFLTFKDKYRQFAWIKLCLEVALSEDSYRPLDTGLKLRVCKMFR